MSKIIVIGGTGILGTELIKNNSKLIPLDSKYDVFEFSKLESYLNKNNPDIIVNCVSIKSENVDINPIGSININIIGSANISKYCLMNNKRLVYISTDYVYEGKKGDYSEESPLLPINNYAWTKLAGEASTRLVKNHLIIRTSFCENSFTYENSYTNHFTSKDFVDIIAPKIDKLIKSTLVGVINVGTERKSAYEMVSRRNFTKPKEYFETKDFSMNIKKLLEYEKNI